MLAEYEATVSLETRNLPDLHCFYWSQNKLFSTLTNKPVEESMAIYNDVDRQDWIGFQNIQSWVSENRQGVAFWLSAPHMLRSPQAKITIYELETVEGQKRTFNRSILFDTTKIGAVRIANELALAFSEQELWFDTEEAVRTTPIFTQGYMSEEAWLARITGIISNHQWDMVASGEDLLEYQKTLDIIKGSGVAPIGQHAVSCPPSLSPNSILSRHSLEGKFIHNCGNCGAELKRIMFTGEHCPYCDGVYEGC